MSELGKKLKLRFTHALLLLVLAGTASCMGLFYRPSRASFFDPAAMGYSHEEVNFKSADGKRLHGWFFPAKGGEEEKGTVVQFHGNGENLTSHFQFLAWLAGYGYNLFIFDYRGYGASEGVAYDPKMIDDDALAALETGRELNLRRSENAGRKLKLAAYGQSLGGTVLLRAVSDWEHRSDLSAVVVESSFPSYIDIAREKLSLHWVTWVFQPLAYLLVSDEYSPAPVIKKISPVPLLIIHGDADRIVPIHHGRRIFDLAREPKEFWEVAEGGHIAAMVKKESPWRGKLVEYLNAR